MQVASKYIRCRLWLQPSYALAESAISRDEENCSGFVIPFVILVLSNLHSLPRHRLNSHGFFSHIAVWLLWLTRIMRLAFVAPRTCIALVDIFFVLGSVASEIRCNKFRKVRARSLDTCFFYVNILHLYLYILLTIVDLNRRNKSKGTLKLHLEFILK